MPHVNKKNRKDVILFAPEKEHHEIPLLLLHFLLKKNRHNVIYFGPNVKLNDMKFYIEQKPVTHLHLHLITNLTGLSPDEYIDKLSADFVDKQIIVSGPFAKEVKVKHYNVRLLKSREEVMKFVEE